MGRDLKDEQLVPDATPTSDAPLMPMPELQLPLDGAHQRTAVQVVLSDFDSAKLAREARDFGTDAKGTKRDFDSWLKELKDLYYGRRLPKDEPWKFCSNRSLKIAMAILETLHARMFSGVYNEDLTHWRPGDVTDAPKAERVEKLMFWWIRVRSKLREFFERWTRYTIAMGFTVTETLWDVWEMDQGQTMPTPQIPGVAPTGPQKVLVPFERTRSDIYPIEDVFLQPGASDIQRDPVVLRMKYLFRDLEGMERNGQAINITQSSDPTIKSLMELLPSEEPQGENLTPDELSELKRVKLRNKEVTVLKWYGGIDLDGDGFPEEVRVLIIPDQQLYIGGIAISDLSARGMRPLDLTSFLPRFDEPQGVWGMGILEQVLELALEVDANFNQLVDANSLSILRPGFYDPNGDIDAPALKLRPLGMTPVARPQESVFFPQIEISTERLILAIRLVLEFIERLTAASAYVMGKESEQVGGSGTATRTQAIVGASNQRHGIPLQRLREGAARIITQHLDTLQKNIPDGMEQRILGQKGEPVFGPNELTVQGISGEFDAYLLPDESMGSKEMERQLSQLLYQNMMQNIIVASDPAKIYKITADVLKSFGKDPVAYLGTAPEISGATTPQDEHTMMLQGDFGGIKASVTQNPLEHMMAHMGFMQDPQLAKLPIPLRQQIIDVLTQHIQQHMQMLQTILAASSHTQKTGGSNANSNGATRGGPGPAAAVGPEPGMGAVQNPLAAAQQVQRTGQGGSTPGQGVGH